MTALDRFLKPIEIAGTPLGKQHKAYKMDEPVGSASSMRQFVGLGECNCCDYFLQRGNTIVLIEETRLAQSMQFHRNEYNYLRDKNKDDLAIKRIREELRLKAYGSLLVLCRLAQKCPDTDGLSQSMKYNFWLIASSTDTDDKVVFDNLKDNLLGMLRGALGKELLHNAEVLPSESLENKLLHP